MRLVTFVIPAGKLHHEICISILIIVNEKKSAMHGPVPVANNNPVF
jgi:hypothetical protein